MVAAKNKPQQSERCESGKSIEERWLEHYYCLGMQVEEKKLDKSLLSLLEKLR
jgi:hypothetical protein